MKAGNAAARAVLLALILPATPAGAGPLQLFGYSGYLGEWELTATVTEDGSTTPKGYSGPLSMKHVGLCTQDGPEEKSGKIRVQILPSKSRIEATLWVDAVECGYHGNLVRLLYRNHGLLRPRACPIETLDQGIEIGFVGFGVIKGPHVSEIQLPLCPRKQMRWMAPAHGI